MYADTREVWDRLVTAARNEGIMGLDTEFSGQDPSEGSCVGTATVHVWSAAVFLKSNRRHHKGYRLSAGATLPSCALSYVPVRELLEDESVKKCVHNLPVDAHVFANRGLVLRGGINTLDTARWFWPHLIPSAGGPGFGLKALREVLLGKPPNYNFKDHFYEMVNNPWMSTKTVVRCACGAVPCHRRSSRPGHTREKVAVVTEHERLVKRVLSIDEVVPGHRLWESLVEYATRDAQDALELYDLAMSQSTERYVPWL